MGLIKEKIMLLEQLKSEKGFTNHEKDVARYILENLDRIPEMSAGEVAKGAFTSGPMSRKNTN